MPNIQEEVKLWEISPTCTVTVLPVGTYLIDGKEVEIVYGKQEVTIPKDKLPTIKRKDVSNPVTSYRLKDSDSELPPEAYKARCEALLVNAIWDDYVSEYVFSDLDAEYAYKKFISSVQPVFTKCITYVDFKYTVVTLPKAVNPFIIPVLDVTGDYKDSAFYYYQGAHIESLITDILGKDNLEKGNHNSFEFVKYKGNYLSIKMPKLKAFLTVSTDSKRVVTKDEAIAAYNLTEKKIRDIISGYKTALRTFDVTTVLPTLEEVLTKLNRVSRPSKDAKEATQQLRLLIIKLRGE